jgi:hypothetical protein
LTDLSTRETGVTKLKKRLKWGLDLMAYPSYYEPTERPGQELGIGHLLNLLLQVVANSCDDGDIVTYYDKWYILL